MVTPIVYRGAKEIGSVIGISEKQVGAYVTNHGLPAWRRSESGLWYALPEDLEKWIKRQRDQYLKTACQ